MANFYFRFRAVLGPIVNILAKYSSFLEPPAFLQPFKGQVWPISLHSVAEAAIFF